MPPIQPSWAKWWPSCVASKTMADSASPQSTAKPRIVFFDTLRGFTVISMVLFHASYDLAYIYGVDIPWFTQGMFQDIWRNSISWTFLLIAGWMCLFSRNNLKRATLYGAVALAVFAGTSIAAVDTPVSFGIIYCMAACTLVFWITKPILEHVHPVLGAALNMIAFAATYGIPKMRYTIGGLAWLGFPSYTFSSGDYYPLLPFVFIFLAGYFLGCIFNRYTEETYPAWMKRDYVHPLTFVGQHSLMVYVLHQPLVLGALTLVMGSI